MRLAGNFVARHNFSKSGIQKWIIQNWTIQKWTIQIWDLYPRSVLTIKILYHHGERAKLNNSISTVLFQHTPSTET